MRFARPTVAIAACAVTTTMLVSGTPAHAADPLAPASTFSYTVNQDGSVVAPIDGANIPNIDSVKSTIRAYYGATKGPDPTYTGTGTAPQIYLPNLTSSPYATQVKKIAADLDTKLAGSGTGKAVVFDVDSTLLSDYAFEEAVNYNYDGTINATWVGHGMDAVPGMVQLVKDLKTDGYDIYAVTGRPGAPGTLSASGGQKQPTLDNLKADGYVDTNGDAIFTDANTFLKGATATASDGTVSIPTEPWVDCAADGNAKACSTVEVKAGTRKHIEAGGVDIVANVGDQWSDLAGGDGSGNAVTNTVKIPNPSYYLGSGDIPGAPADDAAMKPQTTYTMAPDGSTGATATDGDALPNEGNVVNLIRAYYAAPTGIANKTKSPYITQLAGLEKTWTSQIATSCQTQLAKVGAAHASVAAATSALAKANAGVATAEKKVKKAKKKVKKAHGHAKKKAKKKLKAAKRAVTTATGDVTKAKAALAAIKVPAKPAVVFDSDDTTLWNYDMEDGAMKFVFDTGLQNDWVQNEQMYAVPGMPQLVAKVADAGCTIVGLTGRSNDQKYATLGNLVKDGYSDFSRGLFFTKWYDQNDATADRVASKPSYLTCTASPTCSTIEFKSQTRKHIQDDLGYQIVANVGDQFSDLIGGYADATYKIPNPTYYLP